MCLRTLFLSNLFEDCQRAQKLVEVVIGQYFCIFFSVGSQIIGFLK